MKYIRRFNETVDFQDISDMVLELEDFGFDIIKDNNRSSMDIYIFKKVPDNEGYLHHSYYKWSEIKESIFRMIDYSKGSGTDIIIFSAGDSKFTHKINKEADENSGYPLISDDTELMSFSIHIKK